MVTEQDLLRIAALEQDVAAMKALSEARAQREERIEKKVDQLLKAEHERQGREKAALAADHRQQDDKAERNQWIRSVLPTGLLVGVWMAILWVVEQVTGNGPR